MPRPVLAACYSRYFCSKTPSNPCLSWPDQAECVRERLECGGIDEQLARMRMRTRHHHLIHSPASASEPEHECRASRRHVETAGIHFEFRDEGRTHGAFQQ